MAVIDATVVPQDDKTVIITWTGIGNADTGTPVNVARFEGLSVQAAGTFASGTVTMEGSNDGGSNYGALDGGVTLTDETVKAITTPSQVLRPNMSAHAATLTVTVIGRMSA